MTVHYALLQLLDVWEIHYADDCRCHGQTRTFCAVSLRKRADTVIETGGRRLTLSDRSLTFFPANTPYVRRSRYDDMIVLHFVSSEPLFDTVQTVTEFDYDAVLEKFENALSLWNGCEADRFYRVSAILYDIMALFFRHTVPSLYSPPLQTAAEYIKSRMGDPDFSVGDVAKRLGMCPTALRNLFRREAGCSPQQFIIRMRMTEAASLLSSGYWTVTQVAQRLGFSDQKNFSTAFKKHFGYPPSQQRYELPLDKPV